MKFQQGHYFICAHNESQQSHEPNISWSLLNSWTSGSALIIQLLIFSEREQLCVLLLPWADECCSVTGYMHCKMSELSQLVDFIFCRMKRQPAAFLRKSSAGH